MKSSRVLWRLATLAAAGLGFPLAVSAQVLTADGAVQIALKSSPAIVNSGANVLSARGGVYGAYSGVMPHLSAGWSRQGIRTEGDENPIFVVNPADSSLVLTKTKVDRDNYSTTPDVSGTWSILSLSALSDLSAARNDFRAAQHSHAAARNDVALDARRQFYEVVRALQLTLVNSEAVRLARDDERRVRALFDVGSVSRSDLLKADVRTAQAQLDSIVARHQITVQRDLLAELLGVPSASLGEIDTSLIVNPQTYDEPAILTEAEKARPDIAAAEAALKASNASVNAARFLRIPYVTVAGSARFDSKASVTNDPPGTFDGTFSTDRIFTGQIALNWDFFDGFFTESRNAEAHARVARAQEQRDALRRNLSAEVHRALLQYNETLAGVDVAQRAMDSARETVKLIQQKYNVGSATILELIDAQVQLQRAASQLVTARAAVRVSEALVDRVRGTPQ